MVASVAIAVNRAPVRLQRQPRPAAQAAARPSHRALPPPRQLSRQQPASWLPTAIFALKLLASILAGATVTMLLWRDDGKLSGLNSQPAAPAYWPTQESRVARGAPRYTERRDIASEAELDRGIPVNFPRRVKVVIFTPPMRSAAAPAVAPAPGRAPLPIASANPLTGKRLRYLIGTDASRSGSDDEVTEVSYSTNAPARRGVSIAYCNLFDENHTGRYGPYLHTSDTAKQYNEGQIDPRGPGWEKNLREQYERRKKQGFEYVELDNPDAYSMKDVIGAIELAASYGLKVIAKNPGLMGGEAKAYVAHPNVYGIIVERGAGNPAEMEALRRKAGKPDLPVWFVAFGAGRGWAGTVANGAKQFRNMGVTYSSAGEYGNSIDILSPT